MFNSGKNMDPLGQKKHCPNVNQPIYQDNSFGRSYFYNVPKGVLQYNFISFLSFKEQSLIVSKISKAFNELATFAREEQDWKDHVVDAENERMYDDSHLYFNKYLKWQQLKQNNKIISLNCSDPFIDILQKKIKLIQRIVNIKTETESKHKQVWTETFLSLLGNEIQTKEIGLRVEKGFLTSDYFFEVLSNICPQLEHLKIYFNIYNYSAASLNSDINCKGFSQLLLKCERLRIKLFDLENEQDLTFFLRSVERCISLDRNFKVPLDTINVRCLNLDDKWSPILDRCSQLTLFKFDNFYGGMNYKITANFLTSLSQCTQLNTINLSKYIFEPNMKNSVAALLHDILFAEIFKNCKKLKHFSNSNYPIGDFSFNSIISHPNLESIHIALSSLSSLILENTAILNSLKKFKVHFFKNTEIKSIREINANANRIVLTVSKFFPNLIDFSLYHNSKYPLQLNDDTLITLTTLKQLNSIDLGHIHQPFSLKCITLLENHQNLNYLRFEISKSFSLEDFPLKNKFIVANKIISFSTNTNTYLLRKNTKIE